MLKKRFLKKKLLSTGRRLKFKCLRFRIPAQDKSQTETVKLLFEKTGAGMGHLKTIRVVLTNNSYLRVGFQLAVFHNLNQTFINCQVWMQIKHQKFYIVWLSHQLHSEFQTLSYNAMSKPFECVLVSVTFIYYLSLIDSQNIGYLMGCNEKALTKSFIEMIQVPLHDINLMCRWAVVRTQYPIYNHN